LITLAAFAPFAALSAPDSLSLDGAVALALEHHASVRFAESAVASAEAGKSLALSGYWPQIGFTATGTHTEGAFVFNPSIKPANQIYSQYSTGFSASQLIYDFGRTSNKVGANTDQVLASQEDLRATRMAIAANAAVAYYSALEASEVTQVNQEAMKQAEDHLRSARAFYSVGKRPMLDVTTAEVDVANANVALIRARNAEQVAMVQLMNAIGVHPAGGYALLPAPRTDSVGISIDTARAVGFRNRPDIIAARKRYQALDEFASATWSQHLPSLSATGAYNWSGFDEKLYGRWNAGLTLTIPIFQGFGINAQVDQAKAAADGQLAQVRLTMENAMLDVEQNYLAVREAEERTVATAKLVEKAEESLRLAEKQYAAGVGTAIDVTDAQLSRANARITAGQAQYDRAMAIIRLNRAMGVNK
jgi:outer membrane protein TolC